MAITFVNKGTWAAGTTSISPGIPASMAAGDLMILTVHTCNQAVSTITGWTAVTGSPVSTGTANTAGGTRVSTYYRWWQSGDTAPTVSVTGGTVTNGIICGFRGVDATTPFDATPVATTLATANATLTMTGITTATANALIFWSIARDQDLNSTTAVTAYTNGNLTGITEDHDQVVNTGVGGGIWVGHGFKGTAGATGNTTITQTSSIAVGLTIALRAELISTGDLAVTETGSDSFASSGTVLVEGALATTEGADSFASTGDVIVQGALAVAETGSDTFAASGTAGDPSITGALAASESGSDTLTASGKVAVKGALAVSESADSFASAGKVLVKGSLTATEARDSFTSSGKVIVKGSLAASEVRDTLSASGIVSWGPPLFGSLAASESGADSLGASGSISWGPVSGALTAHEAGDTLAANGKIIVSGAFTAIELPDVFVASGGIRIIGTLSVGEIGADRFVGGVLPPIPGPAGSGFAPRPVSGTRPRQAATTRPTAIGGRRPTN
ncbi:MAG: hypothetical protein ABFC67_03710 [Mizugakiibacter sp.]|uniref:hypothetical protein n=1 Tax=Mizugakiibacter sp. TaxID=1972610 RepID=UPI00320E22DF